MWLLTAGVLWYTAEAVWVPNSSWHETSSESNISTSFSPWLGSWSHRRAPRLGHLVLLLHSSNFGINLIISFSLSLHHPTVYSLCATLNFGYRPASPTSPILKHYWPGDTNGYYFVAGRGISTPSEGAISGKNLICFKKHQKYLKHPLNTFRQLWTFVSAVKAWG